jgi:predicted MFS family arabinose efflux permease
MTTMTEIVPAATRPVATPRPRLLTGAVSRLLVVDFGAMCSFYLLLSVVPLYCADRGIATAGAGLSTGLLMIAAVAAELGTPAVAARLGHRRLLAAGLVLLGAPALALPAVTGLATLVAVSVVRGVGFAIVVVAVGALSATAMPAERRGEGMGVLGIAATLPAVVMLPLGVWLAGRFGFTVVFAVAAAAALCPVLLVAAMPEGNGGRVSLRGMRRPAMRRPLLTFAGTAVAGGVAVAFVPGAVSAGVAVPALFLYSAAATVARWLAGRHADRHGAVGLLVPSVVVAALGTGAVALTGSATAVLAGMTVLGAGFGLAQAASLNLMLQRASREEYGPVSAAWNAAYDVGWGAGAIGIGVVVAALGHQAAFAVTALVVLAVLPLARRA